MGIADHHAANAVKAIFLDTKWKVFGLLRSPNLTLENFYLFHLLDFHYQHGLTA